MSDPQETFAGYAEQLVAYANETVAELGDGVAEFGDYTYTVTVAAPDYRWRDFVAQTVPALREALRHINDVDDLTEILAAEWAGKNRTSGRLVIEARIAAVRSVNAAAAHPAGVDGEAW